eukprot:2275299-Pyramimonas_sp.AAC.1
MRGVRQRPNGCTRLTCAPVRSPRARTLAARSKAGNRRPRVPRPKPCSPAPEWSLALPRVACPRFHVTQPTVPCHLQINAGWARA